MIKTLIKVGNRKALIIDKSLLQAAGLDEDAVFQVTIDPNGGIIIQSVQPMNEKLRKKNVEKMMKKHSKLLKRLADQ